MTGQSPGHDLAGSSLSDTRNFFRKNEDQLKTLDISPYIWIVIDQKGLENSTCILVSRHYDDEADKIAEDYKAIRIPLVEAYGMYVNLDLGNMGFEEWADVDAGLQDDGIHKWIGPFPGTNESTNKTVQASDGKREAALKRAKDLGHVE
jgi:hypothetical protein